MEEKQKALLADNFAVLRQREQSLQVQREITAAQLARLMIRQYGDSPSECFAAFCQALPDATGREKLRLCRGLSMPSEEQVPLRGPLRIACVQNPTNATLFSNLQAMGIAVESYTVTSFSHACERVTDRTCDACLLPLATSADGRLFRFYDMLERYDLSVRLAADAETEEESKRVRYVLAGRTPIPIPSDDGLDFEMEFALSDTSLDWEELWEAVLESSARLVSVDSLSASYGNGLSRYYMTLRIRPENTDAMRLYLSLQYSGYDLIGLYRVLPATGHLKRSYFPQGRR
ncbi:MAG: hypothetical protein IJY42_01550 [Clostridia bacterium]|nr:hypothetical protein [Clostridia bacterium]